MQALVKAGVAVSVMHGNRDFLLGEHFARRSGARLLPDPYVLSLPSGQFVLAHGDALCTDDREYQAFRALVRRADWQEAFLARPLAERQQIARAMRQQSESAKRDKAEYLMDVNPGATDDFLRAHGIPAVLFWDNTLVLELTLGLFGVSYVALYWRIVRFKSPRWLRFSPTPARPLAEGDNPQT